jgi:hypothetical protein
MPSSAFVFVTIQLNPWCMVCYLAATSKQDLSANAPSAVSANIDGRTGKFFAEYQPPGSSGTHVVTLQKTAV